MHDARVQDLCAQGFALFQQGEMTAAEAVFVEILRLQPDHFDALHLSGILASRAKDHRRAMAMFDKALALDPRNAACHSNRGNSFLAQGLTDGAIACYDRAIAFADRLPHSDDSLLGWRFPTGFHQTLCTESARYKVDPLWLHAMVWQESKYNPRARSGSSARGLMQFITGPDFPTGGIIVDPPDVIAEAYATGRGSFRVRAKWHKEEGSRGTYEIVVTQIPWLVQKQRLIERMAELFNEKKLPLVAEFRDESTEDVRIVIEPKSRTVDPGILMESLFKLTELESRIPLNMNVLSKGKVPKVMDVAEVLKEWLDHRREGLIRRSKHRLAEITHQIGRAHV